MPALSKKQQKFMGIVRSIQKGDAPASKFSKKAQKSKKQRFYPLYMQQKQHFQRKKSF